MPSWRYPRRPFCSIMLRQNYLSCSPRATYTMKIVKHRKEAKRRKRMYMHSAAFIMQYVLHDLIYSGRWAAIYADILQYRSFSGQIRISDHAARHKWRTSTSARQPENRKQYMAYFAELLEKQSLCTSDSRRCTSTAGCAWYIKTNLKLEACSTFFSLWTCRDTETSIPQDQSDAWEPIAKV
jgi:hypothetical protein